MSRQRILKFIVAFFGSVLVAGALSACGGGTGSAAPAPTGFQVTAAEQSAVVTWNMVPGVEYWLVYTAGTTISANPTPTGPHTWAIAVTSPYTVTSLTNGTTYAFAMDARTGGGPGGPSTASLTAVPRPAGATWTLDASPAGTPMASTHNITGIAYDGSANYVSVASDGAIYTGTVGTAPSIVWAIQPTAAITSFNGVAYLESTDGFAAVGLNGYCQGTSFAAPTCTTNGITWNAVASNGTQSVMVGNGGNFLYLASAGGTWSTAATVGNGNPNLYGVAYVGSTWIAVGAGGAMYTSSTGTSWTPITVSGSTGQDLLGVTAYGATAVAVGVGGAVVTSGDSGVTWTAQTAVTGAPRLNAVNLSSDQILAVGNGGLVYTSPLSTAPTWTTVSTGSTQTTNNLTAVIGSSSLYNAVGASGTNIWAQ